MNNHYIMQAPQAGKGGPGGQAAPTVESNDLGWGWLTLIFFVVVVGLAMLLKKTWPYLRGAFKETLRGYHAGLSDESIAPVTKPRRPMLGDVADPPPRSAQVQQPAPPPPTPPTAVTYQPTTPVIESSQPSPTPAAPGDFEKALAQAGQRMDSLLTQTQELTRLLKLAEKAKTDLQVELNKATGELSRQLGQKDEQITKLDAQLDRRSTFPSLRALIDVKKLCLDMLNTQKEVPREEMVNFITAEIDSQLANLEVQVSEFAVGTPLEKIPGDQVETDRRHEPTEDLAKNNQVYRLLRPCYYLERDSKRIIVAKALVILYRYQPSSPAPEATPSLPPN